jgi:hypothetical protein
MKKFIAVVMLFLVPALLFGAGNNKTVVNASDGATASVTATFAISYVDTVKFIRPVGLTAFAFAAEWQDSVSVTSVTYKRVIDGTPCAAATADTLSSFYAFTGTPTGANPIRSCVQAVTLAPLAEEYWFFVTYAGSACGVTSPTVKYKIIQQRDK